MTKDVLSDILLCALCLLALTACAPASSPDLQGELAEAQATQTAQAAKIDGLTNAIAELQTSRPEGASGIPEGTVAALVAERDGAQLRAADAEATAAAQTAELALAQAEVQRLESALAKAMNQPTPTAAPTPLPTSDQTAAQLYAEGRALYESGEWEAAATKLAQLENTAPGYEAEAVARMLFESHYNLGLDLVEDGQITQAASRFDAALQVRPNDPDAVRQKELASRYLAGVEAEGVNLPEAVQNFATLYDANREYADVAERLRTARIAYGDALAQKGSWCPARDQYDAALHLVESDELKAKRENAQAKCETAQADVYVGEFTGYEDIRSLTTSWAAVRGQVRNSAGKPMIGITVKLRAFDWSATATTDGSGKYAFDFLSNELKFTVSLVDLPSAPAEAATKFGFAALVHFVETP